jgi:hypothetical protein
MVNAAIAIAEFNDESARLDGVIVQFVGVVGTLPAENAAFFLR